MARRFDNVDFPLPDGSVARIGTHVDADGVVTLKLRLPSDFWSVNGVWRGYPGFSSGKTVVVIERTPR